MSTAMRTPTIHILLLLLTALVTGCSSKKVYEGECEYNSDCEAGQVCSDAACQTVDCIETSDCTFGQYCTESYQCDAGCASDNECLAGETCNLDSNTCEAYGCRDTQLDCGYNQYCDTTTGTCYDASEFTCASCGRPNECGSDAGCIPTNFTGEACDAADTSSCGGNSDPTSSCWVIEVGDSCNPLFGDADCEAGWSCDLFDTFSAYCHRDECIESTCAPTCNLNAATDECPRGFQCLEWLGDGQGYCVGECDWMIENGHL